MIITAASGGLNRRQQTAIEVVTLRRPSTESRDRAVNRLRCWQRACRAPLVWEQPQLTINFHPDRPARGDEPLLSAIARSGRLLNQFATGTSNGFTLEEKNAVRVRSEERLFDYCYAGASAEERPIYGAVNLCANPRGGWPRFGSSYWILSPSLRPRCTVSVPGSLGTSAWWGSVEDLLELVPSAEALPAGPNPHRFPLIDGPAELQIHGEVLLGRDVIGAVLDPSFRGTETEQAMRELTRVHGMSLTWTPHLSSDAGALSSRSARLRATERLHAAIERQERVTAEWIGRDTWASSEASPERAAATGASRWLWNRLLLTQVR